MDKLNRDELFSIAVILDLPDLLALCSSYERIDNLICKRNDIWLTKLNNEFPGWKSLGVSPKDTYETLYGLKTLREKLGLSMDLEQIYSLKELDLSNKNITEIPPEISYLQKLSYINLSNNQIKDFTELTKLQNLVILNLDKNLIKDIPMEIGTMYKLKILSLMNNPIKKIPWKLKFDLFSSGLGNTLKIKI